MKAERKIGVMVILDARRSAGKPARREGAMRRLLKSVAARLNTATFSPGELDLAEFPDLLDEEKAAIFYEACLEVFPGQREIYLPLGMADRLLKSQPPVKAELQLIERSRQDHRGSLAIRLPRGSHSEPDSSIFLHFD